MSELLVRRDVTDDLLVEPLMYRHIVVARWFCVHSFLILNNGRSTYQQELFCNVCYNIWHMLYHCKSFQVMKPCLF